jgi:hypothetical protein
MGVDLDQNDSVFSVRRRPRWQIFDPANFAIAHGEGDLVTLQLGLESVERQENLENTLHNFF